MKTKPFEKSFSLFVLFVICCFPAFSQKAPMKFGSVDQADLEMKVYPLDTGAVAVVLCDYGYFNIRTYDFSRTLRIKILKKEGTRWGNLAFPSDENTTVRGITYNLVNGEIEETKLKSESVYEERLWKDYYRTRVAMPDVSVGSVIDIQYTRPWLPPEWRFQEVIPVKWSELIIDESTYIKWRKNYFGFIPLAENTRSRWVAKDVPAFKEEPFVANVANYLSRFTIEILQISVPPSDSYQGYYREFSTTWEAVNNELLESDYFGMVLQGCPFLNDKVKEIEQSKLTSLQKVIAAHEYVKKSIKWNEHEAVYISGDNLSSAFDERIGNSADINLILIQMLKKLDFKVIPVALSTRDNGFLSPVYPSLLQLNYVVAYVWIEGKPYFVDATEEFLPVGLLPVRCLNLQGRLISHGQESDWIDMIPVKKHKTLIQTELTLNTDLILTGIITRKNYDYAALNFRNNYEEIISEDDFLRKKEEAFQGLSILNSEISGLDSIYKPVEEKYEVVIKNRVTKAGNQLYIYPLFFEQITENPFKSEQRVCPVDFIYPSELVFVSMLTIPDGYKVVELPKVMVMKLPDNSLSMQYQISTVGNVVYLTYKFNLNKPHFAIDEYPDLRSFYSELIKKHAEPIIIEAL
jgi:hypothetical protein